MTENTDGKAFYADTLEEAGRMSLVFYPDERVSLLPEDKEFWPIDLRVKDLEAEVLELKKKVQDNEELNARVSCLERLIAGKIEEWAEKLEKMYKRERSDRICANDKEDV